MECRLVRELLSAHADGMLEPDESKRVKAHLVRCAECASEFEALVECIHSLGSMERVPAPPDFLDRVYERIEEPTFLKRIAARLFLPLRVKLPLELAGLAAAAVLVILIQQNAVTVLKYADAPPAEKRAVLSTMPSAQPAKPAAPPVAPGQASDMAREEALAPALPVPAAQNAPPALRLPPAGEPADARRADEHKAAEAAKPLGKTAGSVSAPAGLQSRAEKHSRPALPPAPETIRLALRLRPEGAPAGPGPLLLRER